MRFRIIIPSRTVVDVEAELVTLPGSKGVFGVMPNHAKFTTNIKKEIVTVRTKEDSLKFYVHGGIAQIDGDQLNVLSEFAENLNVARDAFVKDEISELKRLLKDVDDDSIEAKIIHNKISQYEELRKHLPHG